MYQERIYDEALSRIQAKRLQAHRTQEARTEKINQEIPETVEIDQHLRNACFSILRAISSGEPQARADRITAITQYSMEADTMLRQILVQYGYPADYLDVHYSCSACNDTGFVNGITCDCLKREIGLVGAERMNRQSQLSLCSFDTFSLQYYRNLPPEQYRSMENIYHYCRQYAEQFDPKTSGNIFMKGGTGLGKTHLSLSIADVLLKKGFSVIYDSVGSLFHQLELEHFGKDNSDDTLSFIMDCDLLILDDFATEFDTSFTQSVIYSIFNGRLNAHKPIIVNTNYEKEHLKERYGTRILSRLFSAKILVFYGRDIRLQKAFT